MRWPLRQFDPEHRIGQQFDNFALYFNSVFSRHVRISGSPLVIRTVCSKCADRLSVHGHDGPVIPQDAHRAVPMLTIGSMARVMPGFSFGPRARTPIVRHLRFFVQFAPDSMADEFAHHAVAVGHDFVFDGCAQIAQTAAAVGMGDGQFQRVFGHLQAVAALSDRSRRRAPSSPYRHPAVLDHADIEFHDVAVLDAARHRRSRGRLLR